MTLTLLKSQEGGGVDLNYCITHSNNFVFGVWIPVFNDNNQSSPIYSYYI